MCSRYQTLIIQQVIITTVKWLNSGVLTAKNQQLQYLALINQRLKLSRFAALHVQLIFSTAVGAVLQEFAGVNKRLSNRSVLTGSWLKKLVFVVCRPPIYARI